MRVSVLVAAALLVALAACGGSSRPETTTTGSTTVASHSVTATSVATTMIDGGVPARLAFTYTAANDPNHLLGRQGGYSSKVSLQDSRLPKVHNFLPGLAATARAKAPTWSAESASSIDGGAAIECYPSPSGAQRRYETLRGYSGTVLGDGYDYVSGGCVLRLSTDLTPTQARQYQRAFTTASK